MSNIIFQHKNAFKMNKLVFIVLMLIAGSTLAQNVHPRLLVSDADKAAVLQKIERQSWASGIYSQMMNEVKPYVDRHADDPLWILSRYLMNRVEGKRYTHAYSDNNGMRLVSYSGDAPVPTVRVSTQLRAPVTEKGSRYVRPTLEELAPNDTSRLMWMLNPETRKKELIDPQAYITTINGEINNLALTSAILYWLKGDEKYAKFAADIIDQWGRGAFHQEPIVGPCRTGFLDIQSLGDQSHRSLILAYDFVQPYMAAKGYDMSVYPVVFEKFAHTMLTRGYWNNNWYAAESSTMVFAALSLDNPERRDFYLQYFLEKDSVKGGCGQLGMPSTVEKWLTHDGHWKEPGGYHNYPVTNLIQSALALEKNGHDVFTRFPELFQASFAMLKYAFPNLMVSAFGDTGHASQSPQSLEIGLIMAARDGRPELPGMISAMKQLMSGGLYKREDSGWLGMLSYLPELPELDVKPYEWPRSGELEFARFYLQRNGMDPATGLMYGVQGASYNHNHCNGMAMELYGCGHIMGVDAGTGPNYEHPLHINYFSQWAAHNTVVAAGSSSSVPFSGSAGRKNIGQIEAAAMEPMPDKEAVSGSYSFTDTRYLDISTQTNQLRTMAIIRTSPATGYYVDIFRSDNPISNDYVYHNIGDKVEFLNDKGSPLNPVASEYPLTGKDFPGFRFFTGVERLDNHTGALWARFSGSDGNGNPLWMQVWMPGAPDRSYFRAMSPATKTGGRQYNDKPLPVITVRTEKEAWSEPFVAILEPSAGEGNSTVTGVRKMEPLSGKDHTALQVDHNDGSSQLIFQGNDAALETADKDIRFIGHFGVADLKDGEVRKLYLGEGTLLEYNGIYLYAEEGPGSAEVQVDGANQYSISSNSDVRLGFREPAPGKAVLVNGGAEKTLQPVIQGEGVYYTIPAGMDMILRIVN